MWPCLYPSMPPLKHFRGGHLYPKTCRWVKDCLNVELSAVHVMFGLKHLPCLKERLWSQVLDLCFISRPTKASWEQQHSALVKKYSGLVHSCQRYNSCRGLVLLEVLLVIVTTLLIWIWRWIGPERAAPKTSTFSSASFLNGVLNICFCEVSF